MVRLVPGHAAKADEWFAIHSSECVVESLVLFSWWVVINNTTHDLSVYMNMRLLEVIMFLPPVFLNFCVVLPLIAWFWPGGHFGSILGHSGGHFCGRRPQERALQRAFASAIGGLCRRSSEKVTIRTFASGSSWCTNQCRQVKAPNCDFYEQVS